ncbi:MAG: glycosyltransferase [bacterium]
MKILFWPAWYPRPSHPADGIFVRRFAEAVKPYHDVAVICVYSEGKWKEIKGLFKIISEKNDGILELRVNTLRTPIPFLNFFLRFLGSIIAFEKLLKDGFKPDIIHIHIFSAPLSVLFIGKLYGIPLILTEHAAEFTGSALRFWEVWRAKIVMKNCQIILPVTNDLAQALRSYGIKRIFRVIPNVVDTRAFHPLPAGVWETHRKVKPTRFISVGNLIPRKNFSLLIKAGAILAKRRRDFEIWIVGDGPLRNTLEELAEREGIRDLVRFLGAKKPWEVAEIMRQAHIFVFPTLNETYGCVAVEAMSCGLPVIATDVPGVREIVKPSPGILVPSNDAIALAGAMENVLDNLHFHDPRLFSSYAHSNFSYERIGKMLNTIYMAVYNFKNAHKQSG